MKTFNILGAEYFCTNFQAMANVASDSLEDFNRKIPNNVTWINEGSARFEEYRSCALRDVERCLFLAGSHYRRALDLMIPSSSHWAQVTLYYGSWFAAQAILGMFGCRVFHKHVVEVSGTNPGTQQLRRWTVGKKQSQFQFNRDGSHQRLWEAFYGTVPQFRSFAEQNYAHLLSPIGNNTMWLIEQRNRINYNMVESLGLRDLFVDSFSTRTFPNSLPGELNTQYSVCEGLLMIGLSFAAQFKLNTDALNKLGPRGSIGEAIRRNIYWPATPKLVGQINGPHVFGI